MQDQGAGYLLPAYGKLNVQLWMLLSEETMTPISTYLWRWGVVAVHPVCLTTQACHTCLQGEKMLYSYNNTVAVTGSLRSSASAGLPSSLSMVVDAIVGREMICLGIISINIVLPFLSPLLVIFLPVLWSDP